MASKKRRTGNNPRWTYCHQLVHELDAADETNGHISKNNAVQKPPTLLDLPPEVRQQILNATIGDGDLRIANLTEERAT